MGSKRRAAPGSTCCQGVSNPFWVQFYLLSHTQYNPMDTFAASDLLSKGLAAHQAGRVGEARVCYESVLRVAPGEPKVLHLLGLVAVSEGRSEEAVALYRSCLAAEPGFAAAWGNLGDALLMLRRAAEADAAYGRSLSLDPRQARVLNNRSQALKELDRIDDALAACEAAVRLEPENARALNNLGSLYLACQRWHEAVAAHSRAVALRGDMAEAWNNLGNSQLALRRTDEALASYRRARQLSPTSPDIVHNESLVHLLLGDLRAGWEGYERRLEMQSLQRRPAPAGPQWDGRGSLAGRSVVVVAEQGLGDTIQFCRYIPLLVEQGAEVHAVVQKPLQSLVGRMPGIRSVRTPEESLGSFEYHCPLLSLPRAFGTELTSIPASVPYLFARDDLAQGAARWLAGAGRPRIGAVWSGNPMLRKGRNRSIPIGAVARVLTAASPGWVSLQKELAPGEREQLEAAGAVDLSGVLNDFDDTAALLAQLDLVITIDTSVAHLSGAMGIPTWILLPYAADWRWLTGRDDSPWYPTVRLFRQGSPGDWESVLKRVAGELSEHLAVCPGRSSDLPRAAVAV